MTTLARRFRIGVGCVLAVASLLLLFGLPGSAASATLAPTATPAPLVTPEVGPGGYRLKGWTEQDADDSIQQINQQKDLSGVNYYNGAIYKDALITLVQEALFRFPNSRNYESLHWQLVYQQGTVLEYTSSTYSLNTLVIALSRALNNGEVSLNDLPGWLQKRDLEVRAKLDAQNLFGDNQPVTVLQIEAKDELIKDALIAVHDSQAGHFDLVPLRNYWLPYYINSGGGGEDIAIGNHNGNDRPEVTSMVYAWPNHSCGANLSVYEWQGSYPGGHFLNVAGTVPEHIGDSSSYDCGPDTWTYVESAQSSSAALVETSQTNIGLADCPDIINKTYYAWNGGAYQQTVSQLEPYVSNSTLCNVAWANWVGGLDQQAVTTLEAGLQNWTDTEEGNWGPASEDYFRFKLSTWYAIQGDYPKAQAVLQQVRDQPSDPQYTMAPRLARTFLDTYHSSADTFTACQSVVDYARQDWEQSPHTFEVTPLNQPASAPWGFTELAWTQWWEVNTTDICDTSAAFKASVRGARPLTSSEFVEWFRQHNIPVQIVLPVNLTADSQMDWVVVGHTDAGYLTAWLLSTQGSQLDAVQMPGFYSSIDSYYGRWDSCQPSPNMQINIFWYGNQPFVVHISEDPTGLKVDRKDYYVYNSDFLLGLLEDPGAVAATKECNLPATFTWDKAADSFAHAGNTPKMNVIDLGLLESQLFDPSAKLQRTQILKIAEALRDAEINPPSNLQDGDTGHVRYLLGLAYELADNTHDAVNVYWQLWHDYPDSPYALIVQKKLERVQP